MSEETILKADPGSEMLQRKPCGSDTWLSSTQIPDPQNWKKNKGYLKPLYLRLIYEGATAPGTLQSLGAHGKKFVL